MASQALKLIKLRAPISDNSQLSNKEKIIILRGAKLHGCIFPPWKGPPDPAEFLGAWEDNTEFRLSVEQRNALDGWSRPAQEGELLVAQKSVVDLVQDVTTDCSVVASLCALTARSERLGSQHEDLHTTIRFPVDISPNGKYIYKLHFNGCYRKVVIDDRLPNSKAIRSLHCFDRNNPGNVCPALMEKAYLKVRGGYDFAGSNSGTDLWILTGWIPEQLFLQSEDVVPQLFWKRIYNAYNYGDVLITLGTSKMGHREERLTGLTSEHAYAVIDMKEEGDTQLFLIKNPWSKGGSWTGLVDVPTEQAGPKSLLTYSQQPLPEGVFWMDLYSVINGFHTIYLNWNPGLFKYRYDAHFSWKLNGAGSRNSLVDNPQYQVQSRAATTIYLVLTRHFKDNDSNNGESNEHGHGYLGLFAYDSPYRVLLRGRTVKHSHYLDAPNVLLRLEMPANTTYTIVIAEQDLAVDDVQFTLSAFSLESLVHFRPAEDEFSNSITLNGNWSVSSAGGNATSPNYSQNPQYSLQIQSATNLALVLEAANNELAIQVRIVWANGRRIPSVVFSSDVYGDSGEYSKGCAVLSLRNVLPGMYTIVCSTFEEAQYGTFKLTLNSNSENCQVRPIPKDEAGLIITRLPTARLRAGTNRLLAPITVSRNSRLRFIAKIPAAAGGNPISPLKLSIEYGQGPTKRVLLDTGDFASSPELRTAELDLSSNMVSQTGPGVWLVIERIASEYTGDDYIDIEVLANVPGVEIGSWGKESDETIEALRKKLSHSSITYR